MTPILVHPPVRRKAVWGPKRTVLALLLILACMAPTLAFAKPHYREGTRKKAGAPSSRVRNYKVDDELSRRSAGRNQNSTTRVIVTLVDGAKLPTELKRYLRVKHPLRSNPSDSVMSARIDRQRDGIV